MVSQPENSGFLERTPQFSSPTDIFKTVEGESVKLLTQPKFNQI